MEQHLILLDVTQDGIATLTLNRPEKHNAFDDQLIEQLTLALQQCAKHPHIQVLILKAAGKNFSSGADLNWMQRMIRYTESENVDDALRLSHLMHALNYFPKPTIAVIQGHAIGGGIGLIACCDIAIAASDATFCFSEVSLGLAPAVISPYVMAAMNSRACRRYFLTAEPFDAHTAQQTGLIHEVVPAIDLETTTTRYTKKILKNSAAAIQETKQLIFDVSGVNTPEQLSIKTATLIAKLRVSEDAQTRLHTFLEGKEI